MALRLDVWKCVVKTLILSLTTLLVSSPPFFLSLFLSIDNMVDKTKVEVSQAKATELEKKVQSKQAYPTVKQS